MAKRKKKGGKRAPKACRKLLSSKMKGAKSKKAKRVAMQAYHACIRSAGRKAGGKPNLLKGRWRKRTFSAKRLTERLARLRLARLRKSAVPVGDRPGGYEAEGGFVVGGGGD